MPNHPGNSAKKEKPMVALTTPEPEGLPFCCLDFESGGTEAKFHALTQYGAWYFRLQFGNPSPVAIMQTGYRLNPAPRLTVTQEAATMQGLSMAEIYSGKYKDEILAFHEFRIIHQEAGNPYIVSHNAEFEMDFLLAWAERAGYPQFKETIKSRFICTQALLRFCRGVGLLEEGKNDLNTALAIFDLKRSGKKHDAAEDARLTANLFVRLYDLIRDYFQTVTFHDLIAYADGRDVIPKGSTLITAAKRRFVVPFDVPLVNVQSSPRTVGGGRYYLPEFWPADSDKWVKGKDFPLYAVVSHRRVLWGLVSPDTNVDEEPCPANGWFEIEGHYTPLIEEKPDTNPPVDPGNLSTDKVYRVTRRLEWPTTQDGNGDRDIWEVGNLVRVRHRAGSKPEVVFELYPVLGKATDYPNPCPMFCTFIAPETGLPDFLEEASLEEHLKNEAAKHTAFLFGQEQFRAKALERINAAIKQMEHSKMRIGATNAYDILLLMGFVDLPEEYPETVTFRTEQNP